jgi:hypothetical protein
MILIIIRVRISIMYNHVKIRGISVFPGGSVRTCTDDTEIIRSQTEFNSKRLVSVSGSAPDISLLKVYFTLKEHSGYLFKIGGVI